MKKLGLVALLLFGVSAFAANCPTERAQDLALQDLKATSGTISNVKAGAVLYSNDGENYETLVLYSYDWMPTWSENSLSMIGSARFVGVDCEVSNSQGFSVYPVNLKDIE